MKIKPHSGTGYQTHRTGRLEPMDFVTIVHLIGFKPNKPNDGGDGKVVSFWSFTVDGVFCAIWDYKGSHKYGCYSTFGPAMALRAVFGKAYVEER